MVAPFAAFVRLALIIAASAFALVVSEYSVRLALPKYDPTGHISFFADPETGILLGKPNSKTRQIKNSGDYDVEVEFNRHGLRDKHDIADGKSQDLYVIGDSFAFGWGVDRDKRFSDRLEELTRRRVFNVATTANLDGYESLLAYSVGKGAQVRDVVIAINMIDDVRDYGAQSEKAVKSAAVSIPETDAGLTLQTVKDFLLRNSALYFLATSVVGSVDVFRRVFIRLGIVKTVNTVSGGLPGESAIRSTVDRILTLSKKYNLTILIIPSRGLWVGGDRKSTVEAHDSFVRQLRRRGLAPVDMKPVMEKTGDPMQFHFLNDGHWRPQGHALAASVLADAVKSRSQRFN